VTRGKNLKDNDVGLLLVGYVFSSSILNFSFVFCKKSSVYFLFFVIVDVSVCWWMWEGAELQLLDLWKVTAHLTSW